jgi:hypothetical protein
MLDRYFHTGGRLTFGTLPPNDSTHSANSDNDETIIEADEVTRDVDAQDRLGKAIVVARESLWKRRRNHRVAVRRTLQRWQTTRSTRWTEIARSKLSGVDGLGKEIIEKIVGMVRRYTVSPHLTRHIGVGSVDQAGCEEPIDVCDEEVDDIDELRRQQEQELQSLRDSHQAERMAYTEQLEQMESQLKQVAQEAAASAEGGGNDAENPPVDTVEVLLAQNEVHLVERELEDFTAARAGEVTTATAVLEKDLRNRLEVVECDEQRQQIMDQYDAERCELLTKLDFKQTEHRASLQAKLQAKKKAAAAAAERQLAQASPNIAENKDVAIAENSHSRGEGLLHDQDYGDVAKSIVADYTTQVVRIFPSVKRRFHSLRCLSFTACGVSVA